MYEQLKKITRNHKKTGLKCGLSDEQFQNFYFENGKHLKTEETKPKTSTLVWTTRLSVCPCSTVFKCSMSLVQYIYLSLKMSGVNTYPRPFQEAFKAKLMVT